MAKKTEPQSAQKEERGEAATKTTSAQKSFGLSLIRSKSLPIQENTIAIL